MARWLRIRITTFSPSEAGQGGDAEVHRLAADGDAGAPVLRPQAVGDVEPGHDLDPGDEGQPGVPRDLHHLAQDAVDAVADRHPALDRLDVDVARPAGHAVGEHHVHQPDDRPLAGLLGAGRGRLLVVFQLLDLEVAADALEQAVDHLLAAAYISSIRCSGSSPASRAASAPRGRSRRPASSRRRCRTGWRWRSRGRSRSGPPGRRCTGGPPARGRSATARGSIRQCPPPESGTAPRSRSAPVRRSISFRCTAVSHSEPGAGATSWRIAARPAAGSIGSRVGTSHSSVNCMRAARGGRRIGVIRDGMKSNDGRGVRLSPVLGRAWCGPLPRRYEGLEGLLACLEITECRRRKSFDIGFCGCEKRARCTPTAARFPPNAPAGCKAYSTPHQSRLISTVTPTRPSRAPPRPRPGATA